MARYIKRMRIIIEVEMDNHAAMFNRKLFNEKVRRAVDAMKDHGFPQGFVYLATEDTDAEGPLPSNATSRAVV